MEAFAPWLIPAMMAFSTAMTAGSTLYSMANQPNIPEPPAPPIGPTSADEDSSKTAERLRALQADSALSQRARVAANKETTKKTTQLGLTSSGSGSAQTAAPKVSLGI
jgi:hypothetical protein